MHPRTPAQEAAFLQLLEQQDQRTEARRARISEANRALPAPVWFLLGLGAFVTIGFAMFFADRREHFIVQGSLIGAITALVVSGLLLIWFLDHPYENQSGSIKPDEMERQLVIVQAEQVNAPHLCDSLGHAV
jgi:cytochrome c biogenesis protein CcdA